MTASTPPPGWYADPSGPGPAGAPAGLRYWDGQTWTEHRAPASAPARPPYGAASMPPYGGPAVQPARPAGTDGFAIAALVLGILGAIPLAVIFGIVALVRVRRSRQSGKGLAIGGLAAAGAWVAVVGILVAVAVNNPDFGVKHPGQINQADLRVGDCIEVPPTVPDQPHSFPARTCTAPHSGEVFQVQDLRSGDYPGEAVMAQQVLRTCQEQLGTFLGGDTEQSPLHVVYIYPTAVSWASGDRGYICIAVDRQRDVTGSMRGQLSQGS